MDGSGLHGRSLAGVSVSCVDGRSRRLERNDLGGILSCIGTLGEQAVDLGTRSGPAGRALRFSEFFGGPHEIVFFSRFCLRGIAIVFCDGLGDE